MSQVKHKAHCVYQSNDAFVWVPRYRHEGLGGPFARRRKDIYHEVVVELGFGILAPQELGGSRPPVRVLPPKGSPADVVPRFKGRSSRLLMLVFPPRKPRYGGHRAPLGAESS